jgi:hypothetical protein
VNTDNVDPPFQSQFTKYSLDSSIDVGVQYDYQSIMHYGIYAFGKPDTNNPGQYLQTIFSKQAGVTIKDPYDLFGMSNRDAETIQKTYAGTCGTTSANGKSGKLVGFLRWLTLFFR